MGRQYLLGMDNGGTAVKAGLYDVDGNEVAVYKTRVTQHIPQEGWLERSVDEVWQANVTAIRGVLQRSGVDPADILGIAIAGYGNGVFLLDKAHQPVYNCILSGDMRAKEYIKRWLADGTQDKIIKKTNQILWAGQTTPLLAWMKDHMPQVMEKASHALTCKDYLRLRLTGEVAGEISDMSGINAMNQATRKIDPEVLGAMGIGEYQSLLPQKIIGSAEVGGYITRQVAEETGLKAGTPVMGGLFDITACCISTGVTDSSRLCMILGTWSINEYISKTPISSPDLFMTSLYCMDGYYLHMEGSTTSASNLQWFVDNFMQEEAKALEAQGKNIFAYCDQLVVDTSYKDAGILFLPFLYGSNVHLDAKATFIGLSGCHTKAHMLRAVYEGIVFSHMHHIEQLCKYRDKPEAVRISGGGANSAEWVQMFADTLELPIEVPAAQELGAMGAAICAGIGAGHFKTFEEATAVFSKVKSVVQPIPERSVYYKNKYNLYKKLLAALDGSWPEWKLIGK